MRSVLFCLILTTTLIGCDVPPEEQSAPDINELEYVSLPVEMALVPGNLDPNLEFEQVEMPLAVTESYDLVPVQVGAFILDLNEHDPSYLRIEFTSDRIEWVGYSSDSADIYGTQEECEEVEEYCESVIVGQGESGYFEIQDGYAGIQNAYCRFAEESY